ncbi:hypothetical protein EVG20_g2580 [Dentipellis fragilis]|uniref:Uncharacterized protein n=1 Tax=Dentipellis fragilis TaxID=205917 RepID=A0A4Y9ZAJ5_9AGAM|nr:hypothetical protein EVG20_g2580 [Dentipellis fragilis]
MLSSIPSHVVEAAVRYDDVDDDDGSVGQTRSGLFTPIGTGVEDGTPAPSDASTKGKEAPATPAKEEASPSIISVDQEEVQEVPDEVIEPASREATPIPVVDEAATPQAGSGQFSPPKSGYMEPVPSPKPKEAHPAADAEVDIPTQPTLGPASDDENAEAETAPPQEPTEATPEAEQVVDDSQPPEPAPADVSSSKGPAPITRPFDELEGGDTDADAETDADGEADPDYVAGGDNSAFFAEPDAFKLMGSNSTVAPGPIKDDEPSPLATPSSQEETKEELTEDIETVTIDSLSEPPETNGPPEAPVQAEEPIMPEETAAPEEAVEPEKAVEPEQAVALEEPFEPREPEQPNGSKATPDTEEDAATVEAPDAEEQPSTSATTPVDSEPSQTQKSRKRKRKSPAPALPPRVTRSKASTTEAPRRTRSQAKMVTNGKGKQKAKPASKTAPESVKDDSTDIASSRAASVVVENKMLPTPSGSASRAPSIASTESVESLAPSATMEPPPPVDMRPLFHSHTHSFIHHHHHRPAAPPSALAPPITLSQPSAHSRTSSSAIEVQSTSASLQQTPRKLRAPSVSSPVTRSNCKFHKISLPREEGGPRVSFIVPGCSLGDGELMSSQEIVDHGFATFDDHGRMIPDIESLDFNSYLIGVLRQLVGVDLLREQEVFYLPNPGERVSKKPGNKPALDKGKRPRQSISVIDYAALHDPKSPRSPVASASQSRSHRRSVTPSVHSRVTGSYGDAASVTGSSARPQDASRPGTASIMSGNSDLSDVDDLAEEAPKAKRLKRSPLDEADNVSVSSASVSASVGPSQSQSKPTKLRRSTRRPLNPDAAAYKPGPDDAAEESAEEAAPKETKNKRRKSSAKSNKRRLTEDTVSASAPVAKRTRMRKSHSAADAQKS